MFASSEHPHSQVMAGVGLADLVQCALEAVVRDMPSATLAAYTYSQDLREVA